MNSMPIGWVDKKAWLASPTSMKHITYGVVWSVVDQQTSRPRARHS